MFNKPTTSCGCKDPEIWKLISKSRTKPPGEASFNYIYKRYSIGAKNRNHVWELTRENVRDLITNNCYYCGDAPMNAVLSKGSKTPFVSNGIDRKDNEKGYTINNSVPCCKKCNYFKLSMSEKEFMELCRKIVKNYKGLL